MAMKKYADGEGKLEVLRGHEATALDKFENKTGKRLADFDDSERKELHEVLAEARKKNEEDDKRAAEAAKFDESDSNVDSGTSRAGSDNSES